MDLYSDEFWQWLDKCPVHHNASVHNVDMYGTRLGSVNFWIEDEDNEEEEQ